LRDGNFLAEYLVVQVNTRVVYSILLSWVLTLPIAAILGGAIYWTFELERIMNPSIRPGRTRRLRAFCWIALSLFLGAASTHSQEGLLVRVLKLHLDGRPAPLTPAPRLKDGEVLVPLHAFCKAVGAEAKALDGNGQLAVCKGDLCIPLKQAETVSIGGITYAPLTAFGEPLGLRWRTEADALQVTSGAGGQVGLGIGARPPDFTLPDLYTGGPVSLSDYRGRKAVFYVWASW